MYQNDAKMLRHSSNRRGVRIVSISRIGHSAMGDIACVVLRSRSGGAVEAWLLCEERVNTGRWNTFPPELILLLHNRGIGVVLPIQS